MGKMWPIRATIRDNRQLATIYEVDPPIAYSRYDYETNKYETKYTKYVWISAIKFTTILSNPSDPETCIFPCDINGNTDLHVEIGGSYRGGISHSQAIEYLGGYYLLTGPTDRVRLTNKDVEDLLRIFHKMSDFDYMLKHPTSDKQDKTSAASNLVSEILSYLRDSDVHYLTNFLRCVYNSGRGLIPDENVPMVVEVNNEDH